MISRPRTPATLPFAPDASRYRAPPSCPRGPRRGAAARGRAEPRLPLRGPAGSGKRAVARAFAAALLTEGVPDPAGAATRVEHGVHPDLTWVAPASSAGILRGDVDEAVVAGAARTPFESTRRVFVIEDADELNDQAANRMLKTLEEPPPFAHLILLTSRPAEVLPTIASRCQAVRFDAPSVEEIAARLKPRASRPRRPTPARGWASATRSARSRWRSATGRRCVPAPRRRARGAMRGETAGGRG